jgi:hypothetical protein
VIDLVESVSHLKVDSRMFFFYITGSTLLMLTHFSLVLYLIVRFANRRLENIYSADLFVCNPHIDVLSEEFIGLFGHI